MVEIIQTSHQRSLAYGLDPGARPEFDPLPRASLSDLVERNRRLHTHAIPAMETLYQQIANTHNMVILTDAHGVILHSLGDDDFLERARRVALRPGVAWSEQTRGTNAIGTTIAERAPTLVHADQHFLHANHFLTCSAAPITDHRGDLIGVLDVSGDQRSFHQHTMALVKMSALMIENQLCATQHEQAITVRFHARPEFIGTLMEGIACFSPGGRFLSANRQAQCQFGLPPGALAAHSFSSLFDLPLSALHESLHELYLHNGVRVYARAQLPSEPRPVEARPAPRRLSGLRYLNTGDTQLEQVIAKVDKVLGHDIPIMIMGETGTGKELLAQAIHNDSPRAAGPFVAVNCASIPDTLIESELFGYEDGAFTGARKKGGVGKIQQADGGTLFLDEIGDMPIALQARLLRVLQERVVTPLGSARTIPVDVAIICATNHNLRERIAGGQFREDLYYRLNGLVVKLPPLRERTDIDAVVKKILSALPGGAQLTVAPALLDQFRHHRWPGNLRQLSNLLRTAVAMAAGEDSIGPQHMPDDFLDDLGEDEAPATTLKDQSTATIRRALDAHGGNVSAAARALGVSRTTIYRAGLRRSRGRSGCS